MGPLAILPVSDVRLIAPTKDGIQQRVYQVLATYLSTTTDEHIAMSVWIYPDPNVFEFVVMSTKESLTEAQQQIVFAQKQLRLEDEVAIADILASTSLEAQGMGRDQSTDVHTFLNLCSQLPLITSNNPLEATQDENKKNVTLLEYNRSGDEITDILLNWGSESVQPIPASVFPFIPTNEREYSPCRS
ncbi:hypothetical protein SE18_23880 [Herpetosiphon geysericola]|uniref:Uncharacterized protein n=2 Tax=Herpetosiphon geysericola TaxID=70996 RepID=A0A0P6Y5C0_9CHLR|nr:hypothetical protein SE18_23880 [Herpetosiphon geysericola]